MAAAKRPRRWQVGKGVVVDAVGYVYHWQPRQPGRDALLGGIKALHRGGTPVHRPVGQPPEEPLHMAAAHPQRFFIQHAVRGDHIGNFEFAADGGGLMAGALPQALNLHHIVGRHLMEKKFAQAAAAGEAGGAIQREACHPDIMRVQVGAAMIHRADGNLMAAGGEILGQCGGDGGDAAGFGGQVGDGEENIHECVASAP